MYIFFLSSPPDGAPDIVTFVSASEPATRRTPVYVDGEAYLCKDPSRLVVHRASTTMETSFVRLTLEEHRGYIRTAMVEVTFKLEVTKFCTTVAKTYRAWKTERNAKHTMASSNDV